MDIPDLLKEIQRECGSRKDRGKVEDYIPALAKVDIGKFGMTVCLVDGSVHSIGDSNTAFSIQSVSKVFSLALALGKLGDRLWHRVGREPSGYAFNSMIQLESENGRPRNPFINAGAIVVTDSILTGSTPAETLASILRFVRITADDEDIHINKVIAKSEACVGHRNFALANFMRAFGNLNHPA